MTTLTAARKARLLTSGFFPGRSLNTYDSNISSRKRISLSSDLPPGEAARPGVERKHPQEDRREARERPEEHHPRRCVHQDLPLGVDHGLGMERLGDARRDEHQKR